MLQRHGAAAMCRHSLECPGADAAPAGVVSNELPLIDPPPQPGLMQQLASEVLPAVLQQVLPAVRAAVAANSEVAAAFPPSDIVPVVVIILSQNSESYRVGESLH